MFGDVGQARTNAAILLMPIATTQAALAQNPLLYVRPITAYKILDSTAFNFSPYNSLPTIFPFLSIK